MDIFFTNIRVDLYGHNACREKLDRRGCKSENNCDRPQSPHFSRPTANRSYCHNRKFGDREFNRRSENRSNFGRFGSRSSRKNQSRNWSNHNQPCRNRGGW